MDDGPWIDVVFTFTRLRWLHRYWFGIWWVAFAPNGFVEQTTVGTSENERRSDDDKRMNDLFAMCIRTYGTILHHYASPFL